MKYQALFSSKDNTCSKKLKSCLLQFLFGVLRVKILQIKKGPWQGHSQEQSSEFQI